MNTRPAGTIVYVAGDMTPMIVVEQDQWRQWKDRTRRRQIKLRVAAGAPEESATWWLSEFVTGG